MRILFLSAYDTYSHNHWGCGLVKHLPEFDWTYLTLPPRNFSWRIRGNPLGWYSTKKELLDQHYDTILATSMVDLATLCGLFPKLAPAKKIVYFHENQFAYPLNNDQKQRPEPKMVNLYASLAADKVVFNSQYNFESFVAGVGDFISGMPDFNKLDFVDDIVQKSQTLPVPIAEKILCHETRIPKSILWNHRWEYDKNPEDFFNALFSLFEQNVDFQLIIMGQQFRNQPAIFSHAKEKLADRIVCWGEQDNATYQNWLCKSQFVVSTARHEFQGLAIMEAVQNGCIPVVPERLSYPEWFSQEYLYGNSCDELARHLHNNLEASSLVSPNLDHLCWDNLIDRYRQLLVE